MKICQRCGTNQVQRRRDGAWRTLCKCRHCGYKMYDSLSAKEYEEKVLVRMLFDNTNWEEEDDNEVHGNEYRKQRYTCIRKDRTTL